MSDRTENQGRAGLRSCAFLGAIIAAAGVGLGAFGAHGLRSVIPTEMLAVFETAVRYQMYHAAGMVACGLAGVFLERHQRRFLIAGWLFGAGIFLFSGSLYLLSIADLRWAGAITPLGGLCFIAGWLFLAAGFLRERSG